MPTYSYRCTVCGNAFDIVQAFTDDSLTECPVCGGKLRKLFAAVGVSFTGSGFYRNDSRTEDAAKRSRSTSSGASKPSGSGASDSSSSGSSDSSSSGSSDSSGASGSGTVGQGSGTVTPSTPSGPASSGSGSSSPST
ncbi:FmdB family zinc ribbon protein [Clavibacter michiganensis]|uniref:FmdB family transcriptional regulator n=1 Tax=Clavibacter michiganensis subsp. insidiosus TaxID=33014 RepID=A0A0D5CK46_9MICO|nr:FmdB family zinc ribbon protein [Clavibacter michiganensis]AJW79654.1 FmdB family transcriptional regulator [Clavibacter michiganensis subsp. insidiosus]AWF97564.1 FmdB family transcriptional regulator [Clavibacter michiganensis subsp. insidiosus]AWG02358.1 FmdB family transcriptional regulator [Clavibacter michiganensis subsp. insidiosus]OQJ59186.1 FmdB family transcriptional regulator [Clavibacter michiganensis subsp. insidiosus]RII85936.1 FmdB family transcriptional regulator [Clavibacte